MQRPKDAPVQARPAPTAPAGNPVAPPPPVIVLRTPRPLYECVTPDGARYTSDTPEGNPRRLPAWTLGYPVLQRATVIEPGGLDIGYGPGGWRGSYRSGSVRDVIVPTPAGYGAETWVRDACHPLPQAEVCARLRKLRLGLQFYVIMVTARDNKADIVDGLEAGANDYVTKPYSWEELHARVRVGQRVVELQQALMRPQTQMGRNQLQWFFRHVD